VATSNHFQKEPPVTPHNLSPADTGLSEEELEALKCAEHLKHPRDWLPDAPPNYDRISKSLQVLAAALRHRPSPKAVGTLKLYEPRFDMIDQKYLMLDEIGEVVEAVDMKFYDSAQIEPLLLELDSAWDSVCQIENDNVDVQIQAKRWDRLDRVREKIRYLKSPLPAHPRQGEQGEGK